MSAPPPREWSAILADAVATPGVISRAYREFWNYSMGNQLLAMFECYARDLPPGPIHTFMGWKNLGRHVKKGERAIRLCIPVTCKVKPRKDGVGEPEGEEDKQYTRFIYRPNWFVLAQTEGADYVPTELPEWQEGRALTTLNVTRLEFTSLNGNAQGYARERSIAISPIAFMPPKTLFHETAHVLLGHTAEVGPLEDGEVTPVSLREVEAEAVALLCCESLGLDGAAFCRGYIQHWLGGIGNTIPERSAQRILRAADQILRAGRPKTIGGEQEADHEAR